MALKERRLFHRQSLRAAHHHLCRESEEVDRRGLAVDHTRLVQDWHLDLVDRRRRWARTRTHG
jgi:hypothetical protein